MLKSSLCILAAALALVAPAVAQEAPTPPAGDDTQPTQISNAEDQAARANGEWAQRVMAGQPSEGAEGGKEAQRICPGDPDGKPHGVVWGSVGSGGYKSGGVVATQRIGECSAITVGYEQSHGGNGNLGRRRR